MRHGLLLVALLMFASQSTNGEDADGESAATPAGLLKTVAKRNAANRSRLNTWRGAVEIRDQVNVKGEAVVTSASLTEFVYAQSDSSLLWLSTFSEDTAVIDGERVENDLRVRGGLRKEGRFVAVDRPRHPKPHAEGGRPQVSPSVMVYDIGRLSFGPMSSDFDPTYFFGFQGNDVAEYFSHIAAVFERDASPQGWTVTRTGDRVVLEMETFGSRNRWVAALDQGGNLVEFHGASERIVVDWNVEYTENNGVWVPRRFTYRDDGNAGRAQNREIVWKSSIVNSELPSDAFDLSALEGDSSESQQSVPLRIDADRLPVQESPVQQSSDPPSPETQSPGTNDKALLLAGAGVATVLLIGLLLYLRNQRGRGDVR